MNEVMKGVPFSIHTYGLMAHSIAETVSTHHCYQPHPDKKDDMPSGRCFHDGGQSVFEDVARALTKLRILRPIYDGKCGAYGYEFECDIENAALRAIRYFRYGPSFEELLFIFIELQTGHHGLSESFSEPFAPEKQLLPVLDSLTQCGYLEKTDKGFVWSQEMREVNIKSFKLWRLAQELSVFNHLIPMPPFVEEAT
ncbi:MAG: hypothetical protein RIC52_18105 [Amphiplicatus sp.]